MIQERSHPPQQSGHIPWHPAAPHVRTFIAMVVWVLLDWLAEREARRASTREIVPLIARARLLAEDINQFAAEEQQRGRVA